MSKQARIETGVWREYISPKGSREATKRVCDLVQCADCKYGSCAGTECYRVMTHDCFENPMPMDVKPDGFCFWGVRKEGA